MTELEELKKENEILKSQLETLINIDKYDSRYNDLLAEINAGETLIGKYEQALEEIKGFIDDSEKYGITSLKHIKNIISEVENER